MHVTDHPLRPRLCLERLEDRTTPSSGALTGQVSALGVTHSVSIQHIEGPAHAIDPTATTWLVVHGRNDSAAGKLALAQSIQLARPADQVLLLDWSGAAASGLIGAQGESFIVPVGSWAAGALRADGFIGSRLNIVGHSWGSYVADELAARITRDGSASMGVGSMVLLDPATDHPLGFNYNPEDGHINFAAHSGRSWAFHAQVVVDRILAGSVFTPETAHEAFTVTGATHGTIISVFQDLIGRPTDVSQKLSLDRLVTNQGSADWIANRFTERGTWLTFFPSLLDYEAVLGTRVNPDAGSGVPLQLHSVTYFDQATPNALFPTTVVMDEAGDQPPSIGHILAPRAVQQGRRLGMTALAVTDDGFVTNVKFHRDLNRSGLLDAGDELLGTGVRLGNSWTLITSTAGWELGGTLLFAEAFDNGSPAQTDVEPFVVTLVDQRPRPRDLLASGTDFGGDPLVNLYDLVSGSRSSFHAYATSFKGGVRVATGDVTGDGVEDLITAAGPGGGPHVKVFDGVTHGEIRSFFAFAPSFTGGVWVASGDLNDDGLADIIVGADAGGQPQVKVFSGADHSLLADFLAYGPQFTGGVRVASGDLNGDGIADLLMSAGPSGGPHVRALSGADGTELASFFVYSPTFTGGIFIAAGDTDGDSLDDFITGAGATGGPHVKVYSGATQRELQSFFATSPFFTGGVRVTAQDRDGDGKADLIVSLGRLGAPRLLAFKGTTLAALSDTLAYDPTFLGGVFVG